jgi:hypothetical protein
MCSANACKTNCTTSNDCVAGFYCGSTNACVAKKSSGQLCAAATECTSNSCGGRCCSTSDACTCPQPSAGNLIKNPGFDTDLSGWTIDPGATATWTSGDSGNCPFSGAALVSQSDIPSRIWQCVPISPSATYNFGVTIHTGTGFYAHCQVEVFGGSGCTEGAGGVRIAADFIQLNVDWANPTGYFTTTPADKSARVSCFLDVAANNNQTGSFYFDMTYLTPAPGQY